MPDRPIPKGTPVTYPTANGTCSGVVVGRHDRWLIVTTRSSSAPKLVAASSCEVITDAA